MPWTRSELSQLHELARLEAQLDALEHDIRHARSTARESQRTALDLHRTPAAERGRIAGEPVRLHDGTEIVIRPIDPGDAVILQLEFEHLGALSRARGLLPPEPHLTEAQLRRLTDVDHTTHEALVALTAARGEGIGIARYVQLPDDRERATCIVVVTDSWQGRGAGAALAERLAAHARTVGVQCLIARTIVGDVTARRLAAHVGPVTSERHEDGIEELTVDLLA